MARGDDSDKKCFTYIWKLENAPYCCHKGGEHLDSPAFVVDEIGETKWTLELYPRGGLTGDDISFYLRRDYKDADGIVIDCELEFLAGNGTALHSWKSLKNCIPRGGYIGPFPFIARANVFGERRSEFLPEDSLTTRCKIWKSGGEFSKGVQCFACTRVAVEKRSFVWNLSYFGTPEQNQKYTHLVKSWGTDEQLISLELIVNGAPLLNKTVHFVVTPSCQQLKFCVFKFFFVDTSENTNECFVHEIQSHSLVEKKAYTLFRIQNELMLMKKDIISLRCECIFSYGILFQEINRINYDCTPLQNSVSYNNSVSVNNISLPSTSVLKDDLMSILNERVHSDIELRVNTKTYPAHKCILSGRSPVFKAMFSNDMKEKMTHCVKIEDISEDAIFHMLKYIYCAEVGQMEWRTAIDLYEASDKYQILTLKGIVASYLKAHLCTKNVCEVLLRADLHQDEGLKSYAQNFILKEGKAIASEEWENLMKTNLKLATEIMCLKFKE